MRAKYDVYNYGKTAYRYLTVLGSYMPAKGIYSLGWNKWKELPAADFVKSLLDWHNGFERDHRDEPFHPFFAPLVYDGELTIEELRTIHEYQAGIFNLEFYYEGLAHYRAHLAGLYEIRDLFASHLFEETGHNDMFADFMEGFFKMDREKEVYPLMDPMKLAQRQDRGRYERLQKFKRLNANGHFVEIAAAAMLRERLIPKPSRMKGIGFRKHYGAKNKWMIFFDVHSYIDIYHERFGQYILGKYATTKELQNAAETAFKDTVIGQYESEKRLYGNLPVGKK